MGRLGETRFGSDNLEFPILFDGLDGPLELLAQGLGEELLDWDAKLLTEDDSKARIDVVLMEGLAYVMR
jgi:hypothetical protein